jgi:hypothetical protein
MLPEDIRGPEDLRLFTEVALLGVEDQPFFYEKKSERMPIMFGITLPTAKVLDLLTVQGEIYKSPYNDATPFVQGAKPIWNAEATASGKTPGGHGDDFKWSIVGRKAVNKMFTVHAQAASDHIRMTDGKFNQSPVPLTTSWNHDWYYLLRMEFTLR